MSIWNCRSLSHIEMGIWSCCVLYLTQKWASEVVVFSISHRDGHLKLSCFLYHIEMGIWSCRVLYLTQKWASEVVVLSISHRDGHLKLSCSLSHIEMGIGFWTKKLRKCKNGVVQKKTNDGRTTWINREMKKIIDFKRNEKKYFKIVLLILFLILQNKFYEWFWKKWSFVH